MIKAIDGKSAKGKTSNDIMDFLKGFPGTEVILTIERPGTQNEIRVSLLRDEVKVPNVPFYSMVSDDIGYLTLTTFTRDAGRNVGDALKKLKEENPNLQGVIFDLRGNGGGLLTEAVNVSNVFIPKGEMVVSTKGKVIDWDRSFKTLNNPIDREIPLAVLIDKGSASASEIVSGVLQDLDRGVLVGQRSYGKGLVQNTRDVGYNSRVKMTTAKYYIPSGRCIQGVEYKNGEPVNIPDSLRAEFTTRNGRQVLDGGGVKPDLALESPNDISIIKSLLKENASPEIISKNLAELKANKISQKKNGELVLGADSIIDLNNKIISKPSNRNEALAILKKLSGQKHHLISSVCISKNGSMIWNYTDKAELTMKQMSTNELKLYLAKIRDEELYAYNVYQIEGEGRSLFSKIEGDKDTIMGLPIQQIKKYLNTIK